MKIYIRNREEMEFAEFMENRDMALNIELFDVDKYQASIYEAYCWCPVKRIRTKRAEGFGGSPLEATKDLIKEISMGMLAWGLHMYDVEYKIKVPDLYLSEQTKEEILTIGRGV